jgi:hypothetical protein
MRPGPEHTPQNSVFFLHVFSMERSPAATNKNRSRYVARHSTEVLGMRKALVILATVATIGATAVSAPAQARGWGWGPGIGIGLAVGALTAGAYGPYGYYGPGYGYYGYGPRYYAPAYYGYYGRPYYGPGYGPYAYYGGPYYRYRYWRHW